MSSISELPCYTLINHPSEVENSSETQLKSDLGKFFFSHFFHQTISTIVFFLDEKNNTVSNFWQVRREEGFQNKYTKKEKIYR